MLSCLEVLSISISICFVHLQSLLKITPKCEILLKSNSKLFSKCLVLKNHNRPKKNMCVYGHPTYPNFC